MKGYQSFLRKHKMAETEEEQLEVLKNYLFGLSNKDFKKFIYMENIVEDGLFIFAEGTDKDKQYVMDTIQSMEAIILNSRALSAKAA
jgi:acetylglutamate kinase